MEEAEEDKTVIPQAVIMVRELLDKDMLVETD